MNITKYIGEQFGKPTGFGGLVSTFLMNRMNQRQYNCVIKNMNISPKESILDIGFGNGYLVEKLSRKYPNRFYGIEVSEDMINIANRRNAKGVNDGRVHLVKGNVMKMDYADCFFDKVYTVNTIYFWDDIDEGFSEIKRALKPNGIFVNAVYSPEFLNKFKYTQFGFKKYTLKELKKVALRNGFDVVRIVEIKKGNSYCFVYKVSSKHI